MFQLLYVFPYTFLQNGWLWVTRATVKTTLGATNMAAKAIKA